MKQFFLLFCVLCFVLGPAHSSPHNKAVEHKQEDPLTSCYRNFIQLVGAVGKLSSKANECEATARSLEEEFNTKKAALQTIRDAFDDCSQELIQCETSHGISSSPISSDQLISRIVEKRQTAPWELELVEEVEEEQFEEIQNTHKKHSHRQNSAPGCITLSAADIKKISGLKLRIESCQNKTLDLYRQIDSIPEEERVLAQANDVCQLNKPLCEANLRKVSITYQGMVPREGIWLSNLFTAFDDGEYDDQQFRAGSMSNERVAQLATEADPFSIKFHYDPNSCGSCFSSIVPGPHVDPNLNALFPPLYDSSMPTPTLWAPLLGYEQDHPALRTEYLLTPSANRYYYFAAAVLPSQDAFVAKPKYPLFDEELKFIADELIIKGEDVMDAGVMDNSEIWGTLFLNKNNSNLGNETIPQEEISKHMGYMGSSQEPGLERFILGARNPQGIYFDPINADFTTYNYNIMRITFQQRSFSEELVQFYTK